MISLLLSCEKNNNNNDNNYTDIDTISVVNLKVYKNSLLFEEYRYYSNHMPICRITYDSDGSIIDSIYYIFTSNRIDSIFEYSSITSAVTAYKFEYYSVENTIKYNLYSVPREISLNTDNQIIKVTQLFFGENHSDNPHDIFTYDENDNVIISQYIYPVGFRIDSIEYDNKVNPFLNFWYHDDISAKFLSQNNILFQKSYGERYDRIDDEFEEPQYEITISETILRFEYEYNENDIPISKKEINLSKSDTTFFEYVYF